MLRAEAEQVHAIAKLEIASANVELENKIKKLESNLNDIVKSLKDLETKIKRNAPAIVPKVDQKKEVKKNG